MLQADHKKIKIVRVIARLNIGGPAIHTVLLAEGLDKAAFETFLLAGRPDTDEGDMSWLAAEKGVKIEYIPQLGRKICFRDLPAFLKILKLLWKIKPDIIHTHTAKAGTLGRLAAVLAGVPVRIHTFHGHVFDGYFSPVKSNIFIVIERVLGIFTDKVIVVSESVRREISVKLKIVPDRKCAVIKLGFDLSKFLDNGILKGALRKEFKIGSGTLLIGIVGRLVPIKNHKMFLRVAGKVIDSMPGHDLKFLIVGDGELRQYLEAEVRKAGLENHVIFTGWIKDVAKVYADLDIIALTSLNEGTPVSLIEAMASARPVVATSVGGVGDIIMDGERGLLAGSEDVGGFADKVVYLLRDENKRKKMASVGREYARNTFHKDRLIRETESLYRGCLNDKFKIREAGGPGQA